MSVQLGHLVLVHDVPSDGLSTGPPALPQGGDGGSDQHILGVARGLGSLVGLGGGLLGRGLVPVQQRQA